jgi:hypothetical protein
MKLFLIEYVVIPNGTTHYHTLEATSKKAAKDQFERTYEPELIKSVKQLKDNMYFICPDLSEVLCFLHEVGHFINAITTGIDNTGYKEFKTKTYYNINQAIKEYKQIPAEAYADKFAVEFVNKNIIDIWNIMQPELSKEEIREFLEL